MPHRGKRDDHDSVFAGHIILTLAHERENLLVSNPELLTRCVTDIDNT